MTNPLIKLHAFGQSVWLDYIRRSMLTSGELKQLIQEDGLRGVTSNPSIFQKAIAGSRDYDGAIRQLARAGKSVSEIYDTLTVEDIQDAADLFRPVYDESDGADGFVSLEVSPHLAHDTRGTIDEARRLWAALDRPNVLIKVPGTREGLPAIQQLISEGINVNVTLLFGLSRYREVAAAYVAGLEQRAASRLPVDHIASVASFFLSRIDVLVDPMLEKYMGTDTPQAAVAESLHGQVAISSAKVAFHIYNEIFGDPRFRALIQRGARPQRLLWASTSTKNPTYSDVKYVEALIGPDTVNTIPLETLNAYRDHGDPALRLTVGTSRARTVLDELLTLGINLADVTRQLENEGVEKFIQPYDKLMDTLTEERAAALQEPLDVQTLNLGDQQARVDQRIRQLDQAQFIARLWRKDGSLWKPDEKTQGEIRDALGWLHVAEKMEENLRELLVFVEGVRAARFKYVVHLGMGGSSLAPLVFARTIQPASGALPVTVLDTNDPAAIRDVEETVPVEDTLFIVASKSGTTAESHALGEYFYAQVKTLKGERAGENFVAITDPQTPLVKLAEEREFRRVFLNFADIGGRYSALSYFGLVPAALMGIDVAELLGRALQMAHACASSVPAGENPGLVLGAAMGELALQGRNKVTFLVPDAIASLGMWLEQLLAESTGKEGTGLLPVAGEPLGDPAVYGQDRLFVYLDLKDEPDRTLEKGVAALQKAGQPVITIRLDDRLDVAQEFFRWEIATAVAGSILGINPFDQPNVQESKDNTKRLLAEVEKEGHLPEQSPALVEEPLRLYAPSAGPTLAETLAQFLGQAQPGDYVDLMAYLVEDPANDQVLQTIRRRLRDALHIASTVGYGPRFLHSTGQLHKGGPNTGLFLQLITRDDGDDLPIPGAPYTFGVFKHAEASGDLQSLRQHNRRVIQIDLGPDAQAGLSALLDNIDRALNK
jgi:transaldolase/glucose-6-phosphate isomerase